MMQQMRIIVSEGGYAVDRAGIRATGAAKRKGWRNVAEIELADIETGAGDDTTASRRTTNARTHGAEC
jgi:hypothetical protein